jgi:hypothetical protein
MTEPDLEYSPEFRKPTTPRTEAGRTMLGWRGQHQTWTEQRWVTAILAIEDEARADPELTTAYMVGFEKGKDAARADLAARIEARLRAEPTPPRLYALSAWDLDCVLAAIRKEAEG